MQELHLENILVQYPELIEPGLTFIDRQHSTHGKRIDLIFCDVDERWLIVEIKIGTLNRADVGQLLEYRHYIQKDNEALPRGMLVGDKIPPAIAGALEVGGCEYLLISHSDLEAFLRGMDDKELLASIGVESATTAPPPEKGKRAKRADKRYYVDILLKVLKRNPVGKVFKAHELYTLAAEECKESVSLVEKGLLLSDKCYNMTNIGLSIDHPHQLFERISRARYKYLGKDCTYTGIVTWKDIGCGEWKDGVLTKWDNWPSLSTKTASRTKALLIKAAA